MAKVGIIKLSVLPDEDGKRNHVEMVDYKPFKPYRSVDVEYLRQQEPLFLLRSGLMYCCLRWNMRLMDSII